MKADISLTDVSFRYNRQPIVENATLCVRTGEFAAIVGPNGGGKTTLLKLMLGLIRQDKGVIKVLGGHPEQARGRIGYMPQYAHLDMNFPATVMDVVLMGRLERRKFRFNREDRRQAVEALEKVDMAGFTRTGFNELSGGQKQRVLIARALCSLPKILLLDEPTANVDHETGEHLFSILGALNREMTVLLVSHDLGVVSKHVKNVICVNRRVVVHPATNLEGLMIKDIYNTDLKLVRHDHLCSREVPHD